MSLAMLKPLFARKTWGNTELYGCMATVGPAQHAEPLRTAIRTLNHIHAVDRIFRAHLLGELHDFTQTSTVDKPGLGELHVAEAETDQWFESYMAGLPADTLAESPVFRFADGDAGRMTREEMRFHPITHGVYRRGNVGQVLKGIAVMPLRDLLTRFLHVQESSRRQGRALSPF